MAKLEGVCKPRALATERAVRGMRADLRAERLAVAAAKFSQASRLFAATVREISPLPRPPADRATLARWFQLPAQEESNLRRIVAVLRADQPVAFQHASARFVKSGESADNVVLAFGFDYLLLQAVALRIGECDGAPRFQRPWHRASDSPRRCCSRRGASPRPLRSPRPPAPGAPRSAT